ncbi:MAG: dihydroneopterin aldolase [Actinomycetota bacterium]|jgi:dihydroneopterin aldolase|nr:dihydroneopterin aldolase [Actinomycetota bacterium]
MVGERIELRGLRLLGRCGAEPAERAEPQPLEIDLDVSADLARAASTDELAHTVDYAAVCDATVSAVEAPVVLLEHLAQRIADAVLAADGRIEVVDVAVRKLRPPVPHDLASAGVRLTRTR